MTITVANIVEEVRRLARDRDVGEHQRFSDDDIRGAMRMTISDVRRMRPDAFIGSLTANPDPRVEETLDLEEFFFTPIVYLTLAYVLMENDEHARDSMSNNLVALGRAQLAGPA